MFSIHDFIMDTLAGMKGNYPDFQVREYALNWYSKGKLTETDLETVEEWFTPAEVESAEDAAENPLVDGTATDNSEGTED